MRKQSGDTNKSLLRAISLIKIFTPDEPELATVDIARKLSLPVTTTYRIVTTLTKTGMLEQDPKTRKCKIGIELYFAGSLYLQTTHIIKVAEPVTETMNELTEEMILIGTFDRGNTIMISKQESRHHFRFNFHIGTVIPAYASAIGKAFLSELTEVELDNLYPDEELRPVGPKTISTKTNLKINLEQIRKSGISRTREEGYVGDEAVASLIRDNSGKAVAGMSIPVPIFRMNQAYREQLGKLVKMGCSLISYQLGYQDKSNPVRDIQEIISWWEHRKLNLA